MENAGILVISTPEQVADALAIMYRHQKRVKGQGVREARRGRTRKALRDLKLLFFCIVVEKMGILGYLPLSSL